MNYINLKNGDKISALGLGTAKLGSANKTEGAQIVKTAMKHGVDLIDMKADHAAAFVYMEEAAGEKKNELSLIVHFGPDYSTGAEKRGQTLEQIMNSVTAQMQTLRIDKLKYACLDCPDGVADLEASEKNGVMPFLRELKNAGVIRNLCAYTENNEALAELLESGHFAFILVKEGQELQLFEDAEKPAAIIKSPADLVEVHAMLKEYKEN